MEKKRELGILFILGVIYSITASQSLQASVTNGDFSQGWLGWNLVSGDVDINTDDEVAEFFETEDGIASVLNQNFTLAANENTLSFYLEMLIEDNGGGEPETDTFSVYMDSNLLYSLTSTMAPEDPVTVVLDVSAFASGSHTLSFELAHDLGDNEITTVILDDVNYYQSMMVVPVPGALLLGLIGGSSVVLLRKAKYIR